MKGYRGVFQYAEIYQNTCYTQSEHPTIMVLLHAMHGAFHVVGCRFGSAMASVEKVELC